MKGLRRVYPVKGHPSNPAAWAWADCRSLGPMVLEVLGNPAAAEATLVIEGLSYGVRNACGQLIALSPQASGAKESARAHLTAKFESDNRLRPVIVRLRRLRMEVARSRKGRPGYTWAEGWVVINPHTQEGIYPPCALAEAINYARTQWGEHVGFEETP